MQQTFRNYESCSSVLRSSTERSKYYTFIEEVTGSNVVPAHIELSVLFLSFPSGMSLKDTLKEVMHTYSKSYLLTDSGYGISDTIFYTSISVVIILNPEGVPFLLSYPLSPFS